MAELKQVTFSPEVLARIAPDVSLQRHLALESDPIYVISLNSNQSKYLTVLNSKTIMTMYFHH